MEELISNRSSRPDLFCKKGVLKNFPKFTGKDLCQSIFFRTRLVANKVLRGRIDWATFRNTYNQSKRSEIFNVLVKTGLFRFIQILYCKYCLKYCCFRNATFSLAKIFKGKDKIKTERKIPFLDSQYNSQKVKKICRSPRF